MITIVIPAYNEEENIAQLLDEIATCLDDRDLSHRLIAVNDGSTDRTGEILEAYSKRLSMEVIHHPENRSLGGAMRSGLKRAMVLSGENDFIITLDGNNRYPPREIVNLYDRFLDGPDVVVASRYKKGGEEVGAPRRRTLLSKSGNWLYRFFFPIEGISDYTTAFRGMRGGALNKAWNEKGSDLLEETGAAVVPEILLSLRGKDLIFAEIPLVLRHDLKGDARKKKLMENVSGHLRLMLRMFVRGLRGRKG